MNKIHFSAFTRERELKARFLARAGVSVISKRITSIGQPRKLSLSARALSQLFGSGPLMTTLISNENELESAAKTKLRTHRSSHSSL